MKDKIKGRDILTSLAMHDCNFFTGVPDSVLADFVNSLEQAHKEKKLQHIVAANEGNAIAIAAGAWIASNKIPVVYMQNSGLGNAVNPLMSLVHSEVLSIPMLLLIGWRGNNSKDEPQHLPQGRITEEMLHSMGVEFKILSSPSQTNIFIDQSIKHCIEKQAVSALLIPRGSIDSPLFLPDSLNESLPSRSEILEILLSRIPDNDLIITSTGFISRDCLHISREIGRNTKNILMNVGAMGHTSQIALGIALNQPNKKVWCIEGDGSFLMHMGAAATIGSISPQNLKHIVLDNGSHASVGGVRHCVAPMGIHELTDSLGYPIRRSISSNKEFIEFIKQTDHEKCELIIVKIKDQTKNLMRPDQALIKFRDDFIETIRDEKKESNHETNQI